MIKCDFDTANNTCDVTLHIICRSVDETLRLVQAFQYTDKHGEVCPAGWKPGKKTMKPDVVGSLEYFKDQ